MKDLSIKLAILFILLMTVQPIEFAYADIIDNSTLNNTNTLKPITVNIITDEPVVTNSNIDNATISNSIIDKPITDEPVVTNSNIDNSTKSNSMIDKPITDEPVVTNTNIDNSTNLSSLFLNIGFATDLFVTNGAFDLDATTLLFCGSIDVGKVIYKTFGIGVGYSNCNGSISSAHKANIQLLLQQPINKNKRGLTPYLTAGLKYQSLKLRTSKTDAFNAIGTNASIGIRYNFYSFLISAEFDFTYTFFFRESSSPTHALIASVLLKIGVLF